MTYQSYKLYEKVAIGSIILNLLQKYFISQELYHYTVGILQY
jgi:hypothetical protein